MKLSPLSAEIITCNPKSVYTTITLIRHNGYANGIYKMGSESGVKRNAEWVEQRAPKAAKSRRQPEGVEGEGEWGEAEDRKTR